MTTPTTLEPQRRADQRILGLDIARAFAIVGMVIVNFKITMGADASATGTLQSFAALFDGRAAALFVVLAGVGASLGSRRASFGDADAKRAAKVTLVKRAVFLFVIGWAFFPIWPADILHYYGLYLAIGAALLFVNDRTLLTVAAGCVVVSLTFILLFDPFANWNLADYSYRGITTPVGFLRNLFVDGFHPVFPWVSFYIFGMWLGRKELRDAALRRRLAVGAGVIVVVTEAAAWALLGPRGSSLDALDDASWRWLFSVEPIPPLPLYVAAGGATAVLIILGSIWMGERLAPAVTRPAVATGQLALTLYVAHVFVGMGVLEAMGRLESQSLEWAVGTSLVFSAAAVIFATLWQSRFDRGPLEWLMRRVAG
jgi:uncharacterized protein